MEQGNAYVAEYLSRRTIARAARDKPRLIFFLHYKCTRKWWKQLGHVYKCLTKWIKLELYRTSVQVNDDSNVDACI